MLVSEILIIRDGGSELPLHHVEDQPGDVAEYEQQHNAEESQRVAGVVSLCSLQTTDNTHLASPPPALSPD